MKVGGSGSGLQPVLARAHGNCGVRESNRGGGKAIPVGFLGCVRSKLIVLFGEGVCP